MADNWLRYPYAKRPYSDSTLLGKTKAELIQIIRDYEHNYAALYVANERGIKAAQEMLPKMGKWVEECPDCLDGDSVYVCSVCGETWTLIEGTPKDNNMNYCPNCGADMREQEPKQKPTSDPTSTFYDLLYEEGGANTT